MIKIGIILIIAINLCGLVLIIVMGGISRDPRNDRPEK